MGTGRSDVLCGLEVVRTLNDRGLSTKRGIEVICWTNEEGARFSPPMMGSRRRPVHSRRLSNSRWLVTRSST